jgi:hypothetical protein
VCEAPEWVVEEVDVNEDAAEEVDDEDAVDEVDDEDAVDEVDDEDAVDEVDDEDAVDEVDEDAVDEVDDEDAVDEVDDEEEESAEDAEEERGFLRKTTGGRATVALRRRSRSSSSVTISVSEMGAAGGALSSLVPGGHTSTLRLPSALFVTRVVMPRRCATRWMRRRWKKSEAGGKDRVVERYRECERGRGGKQCRVEYSEAVGGNRVERNGGRHRGRRKRCEYYCTRTRERERERERESQTNGPTYK